MAAGPISGLLDALTTRKGALLGGSLLLALAAVVGIGRHSRATVPSTASRPASAAAAASAGGRHVRATSRPTRSRRCTASSRTT